MNVVREINKINEIELNIGNQASWHDDYKDSAYIHVGGLDFELTEGDVITIFSQYGEIMDINMPRDKQSGKPKGFAFLMYEDQRSTVLAVDNLNGANVRNRTLKVDHVKNYRQPKLKGEDGKLYEREEPSFNAKPELIRDDDAASESSVSSAPSIDPEDPMRDYLLQKHREEKAKKKAKSKKSKHPNETPEERRARKERKRAKKVANEREKTALKMNDNNKDRSERKRGWEGRNEVDDRKSRRPRSRSRSITPRIRHFSRSPPYDYMDSRRQDRSTGSRRRSPSPRRKSYDSPRRT